MPFLKENKFAVLSIVALFVLIFIFGEIDSKPNKDCIKVATNPVVAKKTLPVDTIYVVGDTVTEVIYAGEGNTGIIDVAFSFPVDKNKTSVNKNILSFKPSSKNFSWGNIVLKVESGQKQYALSLFVEKIDRDQCRHNDHDKTLECAVKSNSDKSINVIEASQRYLFSLSDRSNNSSSLQKTREEHYKIAEEWDKREREKLNKSLVETARLISESNRTNDK